MAEITVPNGGFEEGNLNSWTILRGDAGKITVTSGDRAPYEGTYGLAVRAEGEIEVQNDTFFDVVPGDAINISCWMMPTRGSDRGTVRVWWFDENNSPINPPYTENPHNTPGHISGTGGYRESRLTNNAVPASARKFKVGFYARKYSESAFSVDSFRVDVTPNRSITLVAPADGSEWVEGDTIQFQAEVGGNTPPVSRVEYLVDGAVVGNSSAAPYRYNFLNAQAGVYEVQARLVLQGNITLLSGVHTFTVVEGEPPPPPTDPREYNASNAYTNLVLENFVGLSSQIPSTAMVAGVEVEIDFALEVLSRTRDIGIDDPSNANDLAPFDIVKNVEAHVSLLDTQGGYSVQGQAEVVSVPIIHTDFPQVETGITDSMKWSVRRNTTPYTIRLGEEDFLWGQDGMAFPDFSSSALGIKFIPRVGAKPEYADAGDAAFRFLIDRVRILVYFDAGSVEYYFASPSGDDVLKGVLAAYCVHGGEWSSGDAYGELQLTPDLVVMDGSAVVIGDEWTIHSSYPPTSSNQIGVVEADEEGWGMRYNGLPTQEDIKNNRSRYEFISTNFYGDKGMYSFYGVHGLERSFAYNNDFFYKICTQPDAGKDRPRHIANHHGHLALGYGDGRVDLSVVGEPYNFDGALGASSWATADPVTGLLPLSGMVLGIFGEKSVTGLSGTTVDNFATQIISAKMGAIEYTIADMGFPVYANHYGIYTLSQVQQYGDFMGTPLSQDISPWLRPRLVRSYTKDEEVVCAWPVRSKNQYRLAFGDGAILTMTINNGQQGAPTFSKQKYFKVPELEDEVECEVSYDMEAIVPIAVSSELSHTGEERIHLAPLTGYTYSALYLFGDLPSGKVGDSVNYTYLTLGGLGPYRYNIVSGSLPEGTTMDPATSRITGQFTVPGFYSWRVQVEDRLGNTAWVDDNCTVDTGELLPPRLSDWRYLQIADDDDSDFSAPDYDDSAWPTGAAPFGGWEDGWGQSQIAEGAPDGFNLPPQYDSRFEEKFGTWWDANTRLWIRRTLTLPAGPPSNIRVVAYIEDHCNFFVNGDLFFSTPVDHHGGIGQTFVVGSDAFVQGENVIAIMCGDESPRSGISIVYADFILEWTTDPPDV